MVPWRVRWDHGAIPSTHVSLFCSCVPDEDTDQSPGHLHLLFYDLREENTHATEAQFYDGQGRNSRLELPGVRLDVTDTGSVTVSIAVPA